MEQVPNYNARLHAIHYLTDEQRTAEVCLAAVQQNGGAIWHLTDDQKQRAGL